MFNSKKIIEIAVNAGLSIMNYYGRDIKIKIKEDNSPVTEADLVANDLIVKSILNNITSEYPIIAEENTVEQNNILETDDSFWLIDPIDGTKGFINQDGQFTVNIGFIYKKKPLLGFIYVPVTNDMYYFDYNNNASFKLDRYGKSKLLRCNFIKDKSLNILISKHMDKGVDILKQNYSISKTTKVGSSLKLCYIAEGIADAYPKISLTMEWDTAAGHAILKGAQGDILDLNGVSLKYGKKDFKNPSFIAFGCNS